MKYLTFLVSSCYVHLRKPDAAIEAIPMFSNQQSVDNAGVEAVLLLHPVLTKATASNMVYKFFNIL